MITKETEGRTPTKDELLEDYKNHPEEFDKDAWYLCSLDTPAGLWLYLRLSDGYWFPYGYGGYDYGRCVRGHEERKEK